jgi:UDP-N-acetylmuramate--alanine ligase
MIMQAQRVHLIGIGGAGLSAIATVLLEQGYQVAGSDLHASPITDRLARLGATVHIGHAAANLGDVDVVIISSAVPQDNPELVEARRRSITVVKRDEWLGHMMAGKRGVAVAGTHGKTTTTAMIALILRDAGLDPTFIVGGDIPQLETNAAAGKSDIFVIEADEYDRTFLGLQPEVAVVTILEWDHPDCYPTPESMHDAFRQFLGRVPKGGVVVACGDEPGVGELLQAWRSAGTGEQTPEAQALPALKTYGLLGSNQWQATHAHPNPRGGYDFNVERTDAPKQGGRRSGQVSLAVPGIHNVKNALAALVVADHLGISWHRAAGTLSHFTGVGRRFEEKGQAGDILVVDDYAHHPTEIRATLAAARARYPGRAIWAVFQPHTYSRTRALLDDFARAFADADHVLLVDIFAAREQDDGSIHSRDILARMSHPDARYVGGLAEAAEFLGRHLHAGDVLITLGAGDGYRIGEMVLKQAARGGAGARPSHASAIRALAQALNTHFGNRLSQDEPLAKHTMLHVGGPADLWLTAETLNELTEAVALARQYAVPVLLLGNGANLLVSDRGVRGLVLHNRCQQVRLSESGDTGATFPKAPSFREGSVETAHILVESGVILPSLVHRLANLGLSGLEWAVGVPGTVGGAVVNNAGAYGSSMADCLVRAELYSPASGRREWQPVEWFEYEYRSSRLKRALGEGAAATRERHVILQAELALTRKTPAEIEKQLAVYGAHRRASQPPGASIGSMFKNPPGDYAGRLIEAAGLKGSQVGGAQISTLHANFFINRGDAKAADFAALIDLARQHVKARFNIDLELEIQKVGDWADA